MRVAVSLPDQLFRDADAAARNLRVSRSQLYARALAKFLDDRRPDQVTSKLNEIYDKHPAKVDPVLDRMQWSALAREKW